MTVYTTPSGTLTPTGSNDDGGSTLTLGFLFQVTTSGCSATGTRWYAIAGMTATAYLFSGTGTILASSSSTSCSTGWNTIMFTTPYAMAASTNYIVGIFQNASQKYTAVAHSALTNGPVSVPSTAGRYNYGATPELSTAANTGNQGLAALWFGTDIIVDDGVSAGFSGNVALSGSGTLSATFVPKHVGTLALSGSGTAAPTFVPKPTGSLGLSGSGTAVGTGNGPVFGSLALSGSGTMTRSFVPKPTGTRALSGAGTLSGTGTPSVAGSLILSGSGTLNGFDSGVGQYGDEFVYYASRSDLVPANRYSLPDHKLAYFRKMTGLTLNTIDDLDAIFYGVGGEFEYFASLSGLTPSRQYSLEDHRERAFKG